MCSIIGYCGICDDLDEFQKGFDKTISRGPDDSRIVDTGNGLLGFHRLAIMGLTASGMQPFSLGGSYVVCNGEIFGFERLRESLPTDIRFRVIRTAKCFCRSMRHMVQKCFVFWMRSLPASSMTEKHRNILRQDPIGIRPLYYGYDKKEPSYLQVKPKI